MSIISVVVTVVVTLNVLMEELVSNKVDVVEIIVSCEEDRVAELDTKEVVKELNTEVVPAESVGDILSTTEREDDTVFETRTEEDMNSEEDSISAELLGVMSKLDEVTRLLVMGNDTLVWRGVTVLCKTDEVIRVIDGTKVVVSWRVVLIGVDTDDVIDVAVFCVTDGVIRRVERSERLEIGVTLNDDTSVAVDVAVVCVVDGVTSVVENNKELELTVTLNDNTSVAVDGRYQLTSECRLRATDYGSH